jgi:hypothetical protein
MIGMEIRGRAGGLHQGGHVSPSLAQVSSTARRVIATGPVDPPVAAWQSETG